MMSRRMVRRLVDPKVGTPADSCCAVDEGGGGCDGRRGRGAPRGPGQDQQVQPPAPARAVNRGRVEHKECEEPLEEEQQPTNYLTKHDPAHTSRRKKKKSSTTSRPSWSLPTRRIPFRKSYQGQGSSYRHTGLTVGQLQNRGRLLPRAAPTGPGNARHLNGEARRGD